MRIYKMTATFGKLSNQTLTLEPGLNIITAPNEWGKSTWCAFLLAMLYGLDTRAKTTKTALADKERYAPWSGQPMEGRIDLNWQGRDITIERRTKRRVPLGEFKAYETESGLPVAELTAANCGQLLLGVEQSVFRRAGFIRQSDLPVTQDEALRRRLNALVTTGDESGAGDKLAENLKDLKNRCRYNRSGLLPQAEREREELLNRLEERNNLEIQCGKLNTRLEELRQWNAQLENHRQAIAYGASQENADRMTQAQTARDQAAQAFLALEVQCRELPSQETAEQKGRQLHALREQWNAVQLEKQMLPRFPEEPQLPSPFVGMLPEEARDMARRDGKLYSGAASSGFPTLLLLLGLVGITGAGLLAGLKVYIPAAVAAGAAVAALVWSFRERSLQKKQAAILLKKYGNPNWKQWADPIGEYEARYRAYHQEMSICRETKGDVEERYLALEEKLTELCGTQPPEAVQAYWQQVQALWTDYHDARREAMRAQSHFDAISAVVKPVDPPSQPDTLTYSESDTARLISDAQAEQQRLLSRMGQYQGRMETLGDRAAMESQAEQLACRIARLEDTYSALSIALETLADARAELQRRFAPRIAKRAQTLLGELTEGRYHSLTMGEDFSLQAGAGEEATLRDSVWRSDGTMDQLYLALRLAVAEELTPEAPLVLDDALVRFDEKRMAAAVEILREMAKDKQVILFTCQGREAQV